MSGPERGALWVMVILGIPCALALWIDFALGPVRRWARRRAGRDGGPLGTGTPPPDPAEAGRYVPRSGGER